MTHTHSTSCFTDIALSCKILHLPPCLPYLLYHNHKFLLIYIYIYNISYFVSNLFFSPLRVETMYVFIPQSFPFHMCTLRVCVHLRAFLFSFFFFFFVWNSAHAFCISVCECEQWLVRECVCVHAALCCFCHHKLKLRVCVCVWELDSAHSFVKLLTYVWLCLCVRVWVCVCVNIYICSRFAVWMCGRRWVNLALLTDSLGWGWGKTEDERHGEVWVAKRFLKLWQRYRPYEMRNNI